MANTKQSVLMVCLGNICRSPIAEAVMQDIVVKAGQEDQWLIDSCGTSTWHIGKQPDDRGQKVMKKNGVKFNHKGRQLCEADFYKFQYIFGMDDSNISNIKLVQPSDGKAIVKLLGSYDPEGRDIIEDPYYGDSDGFQAVFDQCKRCCDSFFKECVVHK